MFPARNLRTLETGSYSDVAWIWWRDKLWAWKGVGRGKHSQMIQETPGVWMSAIMRKEKIEGLRHMT